MKVEGREGMESLSGLGASWSGTKIKGSLRQPPCLGGRQTAGDVISQLFFAVVYDVVGDRWNHSHPFWVHLHQLWVRRSRLFRRQGVLSVSREGFSVEVEPLFSYIVPQ